LGRAPLLLDFTRFDLVDPNVIATKQKNYWKFLNKIGATDSIAEEHEDSILTMLSEELLNGKRPHEMLLLKELLSNDGVLPSRSLVDLLAQNNLTADPATLNSVIAVLSLEFFTEPETRKYGAEPIVTFENDIYSLNKKFLTAFTANLIFNSHVRDVLETGLYLARNRNNWRSDLQVGERYSRKDVCRLLNWKSNQASTIYGYKVDSFSNSCPIFVTYHKSTNVSESTKYPDEFLNPSTLKWFTRSNRTLQTSEVKTIVENQIPLYVFAKKDDAEGTDFYYLGKAISKDAIQTKMAGAGETKLDVVTMTLQLTTPIETSLYEYFEAQTVGI
jgi:hypothetical protein